MKCPALSGYPLFVQEYAWFKATQPLIHMSFCPGKPIMAGFSGSFAPYPFSTLEGCYDGDVISLTRLPVNTLYLGIFAHRPSCGARHERGRAHNPQRSRGFGHAAQHGVRHHSMGMRPHVSHTTSAAAACRSAHAGRVLDDCSALPDWGLRGAVTEGHGAGCQATANFRHHLRIDS